MEERISFGGKATNRDAVEQPGQGVDPDDLSPQTEGEATDLAADLNWRTGREMPVELQAAAFLGEVTEEPGEA